MFQTNFVTPSSWRQSKFCLCCLCFRLCLHQDFVSEQLWFSSNFPDHSPGWFWLQKGSVTFAAFEFATFRPQHQLFQPIDLLIPQQIACWLALQRVVWRRDWVASFAFSVFCHGVHYIWAYWDEYSCSSVLEVKQFQTINACLGYNLQVQRFARVSHSHRTSDHRNKNLH